jgi:sporulation protein YlmC with PRC-barrel domain
MTTKLLSVALLGASVLATAAYAQSTPPASSTSSTPAATTSSTTTTVSSDQKMALKGGWRASKLMGLDVYNEANEKLGDINELIVDKDGKISAVVIGVGGFLGMGEHDIAVTIDKLKFVEEAVRTSSATPSTTTTATRDTTTTGAATPPAAGPTTTTTTTTSASTAKVNDWTPDHAVMSGTKEQLKAMPQFKYSDYN